MRIFTWVSPEYKKRPFYVGYGKIDYEFVAQLLKSAYPNIEFVFARNLEDLFRIRGPRVAVPYNGSEFWQGDPYYRKEEKSESTTYIHAYKDKLETPFFLFQNSFLARASFFGCLDRIDAYYMVRVDRFSDEADFIFIPFTAGDENIHELVQDYNKILARAQKMRVLFNICKKEGIDIGNM